jgi:uncharacterized 2Fe-2S/4Fe-4S cluster protein (DUF4445 family)
MVGKVKIRLIYPDGSYYEYYTFTGVNLWHSMAANGIDVTGSCGGRGTCGKCKVRIEGQVNEISQEEREHLLAEEIKIGERLACYCYINDAVDVYLHYGDFGSDIKVKLFKEINNLQPRVERRKILIPGLDKETPVPLQRRIKKALPGLMLQVGSSNWNELSSLDRVGRPTLELYGLIFDSQLVRAISREEKNAYGIVLDLGSTSLFAALIDLQDGHVRGMTAKTNMQRVYGADVISRVSYCLDNSDGLTRLHQVLINNINGAIEELLRDAEISPDDIYDFVVVGNPVMLHLLLGVNPSGFAIAPYSGIVVDELNFSAYELGFIAGDKAMVYILPQAGGFIGADTIGGLLTLQMQKAGIYLFIDVGTNGEVVLCKKGQFFAASAAAGPAFEGGGITCGARAGEGVIDRVDLDIDGNLQFHIPGSQLANGICGSAIIDLMACILRKEYIDGKGIITSKAAEHLVTRVSERGMEIVLMDGGAGTPVVLNQEDIRQLQLAKAALRTAIDIVMEAAEVSLQQLENIYMAGAFGSYIDPENAMLIRMIPSVDPEKVVNIGNAAAQGAMLALLSDKKRREARILQDKIQCIELANNPGFQEKFINNLDFQNYP